MYNLPNNRCASIVGGCPAFWLSRNRQYNVQGPASLLRPTAGLEGLRQFVGLKWRLYKKSEEILFLSDSKLSIFIFDSCLKHVMMYKYREISKFLLH